MAARWVTLLLLAAALSGCSDGGDEDPSPPSPSSSPAPPAANATLLRQDIVVTMAEMTAELVVPKTPGANATEILIVVRMDQGAWQGFHMEGVPGPCADLGTLSTIVVSLGMSNGGGSAICQVSPGPYTLAWRVDTGAARGRLEVTARVPSA